MKYFILLAVILMGFNEDICAQQFTTSDLRHASGGGPYNWYLSAFTTLGTTSTPINVIEAYREKIGLTNEIRRHAKANTVELTLGKNWDIPSRMAFISAVITEIGFRHTGKEGLREFEYDEYALHARIGIRILPTFPITGYLLVGSSFFNSARILRRQNTREVLMFEKAITLDVRGRIQLFETIGASGGLTPYFEFVYLHGQDQNIDTRTSTTVPLISGPYTFRRFYWGLGLLCPLALKSLP